MKAEIALKNNLDTADRDQMMAALQQSETNFRTFFNTIDDFLFILNGEGRIQECNQTVINRLGYSAAELAGQPVLFVHPPERHQEATEIITAVLQGQADYCPVPLKTKTGELIPVETRVTTGVWNGQPALFGVSKDIAALTVSEEKFAQAFHHNPAIAGLSELETGLYVEVNKTFYETLGFTPEETIGTRASNLVRMDVDFREETIAQLKATGTISNEEAVIYTKSGKPINTLISARIITINGKKYNYTTALDITVQKKAQQALQQERDLFISGSVVVFKWQNRKKWPVEYVSPNVQDILGYSAASFQQGEIQYADLIHLEDRNRVEAEVQTAKENHDTHLSHKPYRLQHRAGHNVWVLDSTTVLRNSAGEITHYLGYLVDITARIEAERALQKSERRLKQAERLANLGHWELNLKNNKLYWSDEIFRIFDIDQAEFEASYDAFLNAIHPDDRDRVNQAYRLSIQNKTGYNIDHRLLMPNGRVKFVHEQGRTYYNQAGEAEYSIGTVQDITDRKLIEEALQVERRRLSDILEGTHVGTWEWYVQTGATVFNERWANIIGYTLAELAPISIDTWIKFSHPDDLIRSNELLQKNFNRELEYYDCETRMRHRDGHWIWVLDRGRVAVWGENDKPILMSGTHQDITDHKLLEQRLRKAKDDAEAANRAKSAFLSNMSHELRTPLNGILGYTQIFKRDPKLPPQYDQGIEIIHRSGEHLLTLISDILDISKIEADRVELLPTEIHLPTFLRTIVDMISIRAEEKYLAFHYESDDRLPITIHADETRLRQVLLNLLTNAVKFTPSGTIWLRISTIQQETVRPSQPTETNETVVTLRFEVQDTGVGISAADQENIFEPFQQSGDKQLQQKGSGLGLSISRRLVTMMGGELQFESNPQGSRFWFQAPFSAGYNVELNPKLQTEQEIGYHAINHETPLKILLVDDMVENRSVLREFLLNLGFEVGEASDGLEAIAQTDQFDPDLILMDLIMPTMDGLTATHQIKTLPGHQQLPIIALSASIGPEARQKSFEAGCDDFLSKPFEAAAILNTLHTHLPLEWIYHDTPKATAAPATTLPPAETLNQMLALASIGDVMALERILDDLWAANVAYQPFVTQLRRLTAKFNLDEIEALLRKKL